MSRVAMASLLAIVGRIRMLGLKLSWLLLILSLKPVASHVVQTLRASTGLTMGVRAWCRRGHVHWRRRRPVRGKVAICRRVLSRRHVLMVRVVMVALQGLKRCDRRRMHQTRMGSSKSIAAVAPVMLKRVMTLVLLLLLLHLHMLLMLQRCLFIDFDPVLLGSPVLEPDLVGKPWNMQWMRIFSNMPSACTGMWVSLGVERTCE